MSDTSDYQARDVASGSRRWARVQTERQNWSETFRTEIERAGQPGWQTFSSYWWQDYYREMTATVKKLMSGHDMPSVLEVGSGSGKASLLLPNQWPKTLLDISDVALSYANVLAERLHVDAPQRVEGDAFRAPFRDSSFSLVWNIGMVEHYEEADVCALLAEMLRLCSPNGIVAFGVPTAWSGAVLKARVISWAPLRWIPGYKVDTEIWYTTGRLVTLLRRTAQQSGVGLQFLRVSKIGSPLPMEAPATLVRVSQPLLDRMLKPLKFLSLISVRVVK